MIEDLPGSDVGPEDDRDPEDDPESVSQPSDESLESSEEDKTSMPREDLNMPITPNDLGLPDDYDHERDSRHIPTAQDLQQAALSALDRETAFVVYHQDQPRLIADRLEELAEVARAAASIKGDHQPKAIRLALALKVEYWWSRNKLRKWKNLVAPMLMLALRAGNYGLESEIFRAWSNYLYITSETDAEAARNAIGAAEEYAQDAGRDDLRLLMRAERFNIDVLDLTLDQAHVRAADLLDEARRMRFDHVRGRVYRSLARAYSKAGLPDEVFVYAQQALVIFTHEQNYSAMGACVSSMFNSLYQNRAPLSDSYGDQLLAFLDSLAVHGVSPQFQASFYYAQALRSFWSEDYDRAREFTLKAWLYYRVMAFRPSLIRVQHMLGLVQTKRHRWQTAERYLTACQGFYERAGDSTHIIYARHALAYIPVEQGDLPRALAALEDVLHGAERLEEVVVRERAIKLIREDIEEVKRRMAAPDA